MKLNRILVCFLLILALLSCRNDDDGLIPGTFVPPQTLAETAEQNDAEIQNYLRAHFYNYEEFENPPEDFDFKIRIGTMEGDTTGKVSLMDRPELSMKSITVTSEEVGRPEDENESVAHTLYVLNVRQGVNEGPTIGDAAILQYEGFLTSNELFDGFSTPVRQYLPQFLRGYREAITMFDVGNGPIDLGDGTVAYEDYGIGMVFMPSGLGYFDNGEISAVPAYSPIIFKFDVLATELNTDFDEDGIPTILEDLNNNRLFNDDNTDEDFLSNHVDADDDNDGIPTIEEIELDAEGNFVAFKDTDGDGTPDHLDNDN